MSADKKEGPRDWDRELAEIDKLIAQNPVPAQLPEKRGTAAQRHSGTGQSVQSPRAAVPLSPASGRYATLFTWLRLTLGLAVGVGMTQWPYTHGCGLSLAAYLAGVATVIVAALWSVVSSWRTRSGFAHFLSIALLVWGGALAAREVLPRIGYAKDTATWQCPAPSPTP